MLGFHALGELPVGALFGGASLYPWAKIIIYLSPVLILQYGRAAEITRTLSVDSIIETGYSVSVIAEQQIYITSQLSQASTYSKAEL